MASSTGKTCKALVLALLCASAGVALAETAIPYRWGEIKPATAEGFAGKSIIVPWYDAEGRARLARGPANTDFYQLAHAYQPQQNPVYATVASAVIVLNALRQPAHAAPTDPAHEIAKPAALGGGNLPFPAYSQDTFLNEKTDAIKDRELILLKREARPGLGLDDLSRMLREVYKLEAPVTTARAALEPGAAEFRKVVKRVLADKTTFILANFDGRLLGASTEGTVSPLAAYDEATDSVLILDVTAHKNPWYWVPLRALYAAMHTQYDNVWRGYITIAEPAAAAKPKPGSWQTCKAYFDGCNHCNRTDKGTICTRKYCPPEARQEPRCVER